jgi:hypothetical protein
VCPFTVVYGENCSTSGEEPFVFDIVHCANTLNKSLAKVKPLFLNGWFYMHAGTSPLFSGELPPHQLVLYCSNILNYS